MIPNNNKQFQIIFLFGEEYIFAYFANSFRVSKPYMISRNKNENKIYLYVRISPKIK